MSDPILEKCQCGHEKCDYHGISDGRFNQGNGWDKATAERYLYARLWADYLGLTTPELIQQVQAFQAANAERIEQ